MFSVVHVSSLQRGDDVHHPSIFGVPPAPDESILLQLVHDAGDVSRGHTETVGQLPLGRPTARQRRVEREVRKHG